MGHHPVYPENFSSCREIFYNSVEKNFIRKIPVHGIVFELKNVLVSIIKLYIKVRAHSFARDIVLKNKSKLKKQSLRYCVRTYKSAIQEYSTRV